MLPEQTQPELEQYKNILLATIDYEMEKGSGRLQPGEHERYTDHYRLVKQNIEKSYQKDGLKKLKKMLQHFTFIRKVMGDLDYGKYIKEKTGHNYDIFEGIHERISKIIAKKKIINKEQQHDAITAIQLYRKTSVGQENSPLLQNLLADFSALRHPRGNHFFVNHLAEINAPDNRCFIAITEFGVEADRCSTQVNLNIKDVSYSVYHVNDINLSVKAYWKDNNTIVIETGKNYKGVIKRNQIEHEFLQEAVMVEYFES